MKNEKIKKGKTEGEEEEIKVGDTGVAKNSNAKEALKKVIEIYKVQNPVKYAHKKAALEKQLASL